MDGQPLGRTLIITYTGNNNIQFKKYYNGNQPLSTQLTPNESYEYKYDNAWKDQLTRIIKYVDDVEDSTETISYGGSNFIGNPSSIGSKTLTWSGRRLIAITEPNKDNIEYFYNEEGIRTKKIVGSDITTYELNGSNIISETKNGTQTTRYIYNERGLLVGFEYLSKMYYYIRDLLGIITEIVDENKEVMVSYKYDAWGRLLNKVYTPNTVGEDIAELNSFVYKGYYLDEETGWYYLKSRYYDSRISRFINLDKIEYIKKGSIDEGNLFSYCTNNPITYFDIEGTAWWHWAVAAVVVVGLAVALVATAGGATPAVIALTQVAYGYAAASMTTTILASALIGSSVALVGTAIYAAGSATSIEDFADSGETAMWLTIGGGMLGGGLGYLNFANNGYTQFGNQTPSKNYPFGSYTNTKDPNNVKVTHYGLNGKMWWSKHFGDHYQPWAHPIVPHWHAEDPHSKWFGSVKELIKELFRRFFGGK